jgi:hypothetical protein
MIKLNELDSILDQPGIKCFILTNKECPTCAEWMANDFDKIKFRFPDLNFYPIDTYSELQEGRMYFPPMVAPTFYFYKDKKEFPLISQGILPELEMSRSIERAIKVLSDD